MKTELKKSLTRLAEWMVDLEDERNKNPLAVKDLLPFGPVTWSEVSRQARAESVRYYRITDLRIAIQPILDKIKRRNKHTNKRTKVNGIARRAAKKANMKRRDEKNLSCGS